MSAPILATKFYIPTPHHSLTPRPRLLCKLQEALTKPLLLISAPAGFGKTTLLAQWRQSAPGQATPLAWLTLEPEDGEPLRFLTCLALALDPLLPGLSAELQMRRQTGAASTAHELLVELLQLLNCQPHPFVLVLEDYHLIQEPAIHDQLAYLIRHCPPAMHLMLSSRAEPPLALARLRVRGDLIEIRAEDLRFTHEECVTYLSQVMGLTLAAGEIEALEVRTEGWIAGLKLAALSLQNAPPGELSTLVADFAGTHRYIADYLVEEVLNGLSDEVRTFLLQTSVLSVLGGALCDAVTGQRGGQAMLETLEQENLFLVRLDEDRSWFRYHHLFAELLRHRLNQRHPGLAQQLSRRAVAWYEQQEMWECAIDEAFNAHDYELAATMLARAYPALLASGQASTLNYWLQALPRPALANQRSLAALLPLVVNQRLTARELEITQLLAQGASNRQIAQTLVVSLGAVKKHLNNIFLKLEAQNRTQVVIRARELGLL